MATTSRLGWPTPDNTDRVADGAAAMRSLGDAIDTDFTESRVGSYPITSLGSGSVTTFTATFTGFAYGNTPIVVASTSHQNLRVNVTSRTDTSATFRVENIGGSTTSGTVLWIAAIGAP